MNLQEHLASLKRLAGDPDWVGQPNEWVKNLATGEKGRLGEEIAVSALGAKKLPNNRSGYDVELGEKKIEVKLACTGRKNGYLYIQWQQIRPSDPYTHIAFIAVYPSRVRLFLVPKNEIPPLDLLHMHGRDKSLDIYCITTRKVDELFHWMKRHEVHPAVT